MRWLRQIVSYLSGRVDWSSMTADQIWAAGQTMPFVAGPWTRHFTPNGRVRWVRLDIKGREACTAVATSTLSDGFDIFVIAPVRGPLMVRSAPDADTARILADAAATQVGWLVTS